MVLNRGSVFREKRAQMLEDALGLFALKSDDGGYPAIFLRAPGGAHHPESGLQGSQDKQKRSGGGFLGVIICRLSSACLALFGPTAATTAQRAPSRPSSHGSSQISSTSTNGDGESHRQLEVAVNCRGLCLM